MRRLAAVSAWAAAALLFSLLFSGCFLISVYPFAEESQLVYDPALVGTWHLKNCSQNREHAANYCVLTISGAKNDDGAYRAYDLVLRDDAGKTTEMAGGVFDLEGVRLLTTAGGYEGMGIGTVLHWIPAYVAWKVQATPAELTITPIRRSLAREAASAQPPLATFPSDGDTILAAPTPELQRWLAKHVMNPESYDTPLVWKKGPPPAAAKAPPKKK